VEAEPELEAIREGPVSTKEDGYWKYKWLVLTASTLGIHESKVHHAFHPQLLS
jgi:hypothetical protein